MVEELFQPRVTGFVLAASTGNPMWRCRRRRVLQALGQSGRGGVHAVSQCCYSNISAKKKGSKIPGTT